MKRIWVFSGVFCIFLIVLNCNYVNKEKSIETLVTKQIKNLPITENEPLLYSLEKNKTLSNDLNLTTRWDIEFDVTFVEEPKETYEIIVRPNNKELKNSSGYGGQGQVEMFFYQDQKIERKYFNSSKDIPRKVPSAKLFDKIFDNLKEVPLDEMEPMDEISKHEPNLHKGWYYYGLKLNFSQNLNQAFDLFDQEDKVGPTLPRVILLKTTKGHWVKLIIQFFKFGSDLDGKDIEELDVDDIDVNDPLGISDITKGAATKSKSGYLNFKYSIQKDGTEIFESD